MDDNIVSKPKDITKSVEEIFRSGDVLMWSNDSQWIDVEQEEKVAE